MPINGNARLPSFTFICHIKCGNFEFTSEIVVCLFTRAIKNLRGRNNRSVLFRMNLSIYLGIKYVILAFLHAKVIFHSLQRLWCIEPFKNIEFVNFEGDGLLDAALKCEDSGKICAFILIRNFGSDLIYFW
jgi:hypothetical protein